ncbi:MAG: hypothetical protein LBR31_07955 [Desulfovibrio sp.]|jgi:hypothetical protein|nr:hypothetical protein [Desulfovibrio sp.]
MQNSAVILANFGIALWHACVGLVLSLHALEADPETSTWRFALWQYGPVLAAGLSFSLFARRGRPSTAPLLFAGLTLCAAPLLCLAGARLDPRFTDPLWLSVCLGVFQPVVFWIFIGAFPSRHSGLLLGLNMTIEELCLLVFSSITHTETPAVFLGESLAHLHTVIAVMVAGIGVCLLCLVLNGGALLSSGPAEEGDGNSAPKWLFAAGIVFFTVFGMVMEQPLPRAWPPPETPSLWHFLLPLFPPFAGRILDADTRRGAGILLVLLACAVALASLAGMRSETASCSSSFCTSYGVFSS